MWRRVLVAAAMLGGCQALPAPSPQSGAQEPRTIFRSVTVVPMDRTGSLPDRDVVVADGRVVEVRAGGSATARASDTVIDGRGKFLTPALWDMHVHAAAKPFDTADGEGLALYLAYGVTGVREMGVNINRFAGLKQKAGAAKDAPEMVAAGPLLDGPARPYQPEPALQLADAAAARQAVKDLKAAGVDFLKPYDGLTLEQYQAVAEEAKAAGLYLAGHVPMRVSLQQAVDAGQRSIEHVSLKLIDSCAPDGMQALPGMLRVYATEGPEGKYREINVWAGKRDRAACAAIYRRMAELGVHVTPTLTFELVAAPYVTAADFADLPGAARERCITALERAGAESEARRGAMRSMLEMIGDLHRAGVSLLAGTDVPNSCTSPGRSLHAELKLLTAAGLSNEEALRTATVNPAKFLGREADGVVRAGARANLLLLDGDPLGDIANTQRIAGLMQDGRWRDAAELAALKAAAMRAIAAAQ